jgi:hypothetical protein
MRKAPSNTQRYLVSPSQNIEHKSIEFKMSAIQPAALPSAGYYGNKSDVSVDRTGTVDKTGAGINVSDENEHNGSSAAMGNPTLEQVAQTKGRWFQYVKTKQFWITLLLGQCMSLSQSHITHDPKY